MKRITPTRVIETGRLARGSSGQGVGWLQNLVERARNLRAQVVGINERITSPLRDGVPACVSGELRFQADQNKTVSIAQFPPRPDANPPNVGAAAFIAPLLVNPIILSGQTYRIPITFSPPGILQAHNLVVGIEAGFTMFANQNVSGITPLNDYRQTSTNTGGGYVMNPDLQAIQYSWQQQVLGTLGQPSGIMAYLPYVWNIIDEKSGRQYAQDWVPSGVLLGTRGYSQSVVGSSPIDSDLFEFDTPWIFERDAQVAFLFRPIMDLYQVAAASATLPYGVDDRSGGRRFQEATVRVEFHGNRYYTSQDVLKDGAMVTNANDPSQRSRPERKRP
jgi:hypothetical protein